MKNTRIVLYLMFGFILILAPALFQIGCSSNNSPATPAAPTATPTPANTFTPTSTPTNSLNAFITIGSGTLSGPAGIQYVSGRLRVVDNGNQNLQLWTTVGVALGSPITGYGTPVTQFSYPSGEGLDTVNNIYVADQLNSQVVVFNSSGSFVTVFGKAQLGSDSVNGVGVNNAGTTLYISDTTANHILVYSISGSTYTYHSTFSSSGNAALSFPREIFVDGVGYVYVADSAHHRVAQFDGLGVFNQSFTAPQLVTPYGGLYVDSSYNLYVSDFTNSLVVKFNSSGTVIGQFGVGILYQPMGITMDLSTTGYFYVSDFANGRIVGFH